MRVGLQINTQNDLKQQVTPYIHMHTHIYSILMAFLQVVATFFVHKTHSYVSSRARSKLHKFHIMPQCLYRLSSPCNSIITVLHYPSQPLVTIYYIKWHTLHIDAYYNGILCKITCTDWRSNSPRKIRSDSITDFSLSVHRQDHALHYSASHGKNDATYLVAAENIPRILARCLATNWSVKMTLRSTSSMWPLTACPRCARITCH